MSVVHANKYFAIYGNAFIIHANARVELSAATPAVSCSPPSSAPNFTANLRFGNCISPMEKVNFIIELRGFAELKNIGAKCFGHRLDTGFSVEFEAGAVEEKAIACPSHNRIVPHGKSRKWKCIFYALLLLLLQDGPQNDRSVELPYGSLSDCLGEEFICDFSATPETTLAVLSAALRSLAGSESCLGRISARVIEFPETFEFADLRSCMLGKYA